MDPEEKVRAVACRVIGEMNLDHIIDHVDIKLLQEIAARCKDKKVKYYAVRSMGILSDASLVICTQSSHVYPWFALPCSLSQNVGVKSNNAYSCVAQHSMAPLVKKTMKVLFPSLDGYPKVYFTAFMWMMYLSRKSSRMENENERC